MNGKETDDKKSQPSFLPSVDLIFWLHLDGTTSMCCGAHHSPQTAVIQNWNLAETPCSFSLVFLPRETQVCGGYRGGRGVTWTEELKSVPRYTIIVLLSAFLDDNSC